MGTNVALAAHGRSSEVFTAVPQRLAATRQQLAALGPQLLESMSTRRYRCTAEHRCHWCLVARCGGCLGLQEAPARIGSFRATWLAKGRMRVVRACSGSWMHLHAFMIHIHGVLLYGKKAK